MVERQSDVNVADLNIERGIGRERKLVFGVLQVYAVETYLVHVCGQSGIIGLLSDLDVTQMELLKLFDQISVY